MQNKKEQQNTIAYIDFSNLKFGVKQSGWVIDYKSFRSWLRDKFKTEKAILFMGLVPASFDFYNYLQNLFFDIAFKPIIIDKDGQTKGSVDGELILRIVRDYYENKLKKVILVSGDGDYRCVVEFLKEKKVPIVVVSPNRKYLSLLLKKTNVPIIILDELKDKLRRK